MKQDIGKSDWERVDYALDHVLSLVSGKRASWIEKHFADEPALGLRTKILLDKAANNDALFTVLEQKRDMFLDMVVPEFASDSEDPRLGAHYGPWKIVSHIGSGGLAEVYQVERDDDRYRQKAALKIMRASILSDDLVKLFHRERNVLASLDHHGLVRIIDGGETATGSPWLVMEYVDGLAITEHCATNELPLAERLALVAQAADALQAAHNRLVLHGDIKPEHVVVQEDGSIKLLDFGIAQLLDEDGLGGPAIAVSPAIASPEHRAGTALTISSDIFQLGLVLKQLISDFDLDADHMAVAEMATASDPAARYPSAAQFATDLRKLIDGQAVMAAPDSKAAGLWRLIRRNPWTAALAASLLLGLAGWGLTASIYANQIREQRNIAVAALDRVERGKDMLLNLFRRFDPLEMDAVGPQSATTLRMLEASLADARENLADDPALIADLLGWTARGHQRADDLPSAEKLAAEAVALLDRAKVPQDNAYASALAYLGYLQSLGGDRKAGQAKLDKAMVLLDRNRTEDIHALDTMLVVAWRQEGQWTEQKKLFERVEALAGKLDQIPAVVEAGSGLGRSLTGLGEGAAAETQLNKTLDVARKYYGDDHPRLSIIYSDLGRLAASQGKPHAAIEYHRKALELSVAAFGPDYSSNLSHRSNLALALVEAGQIEAAISQFRKILLQTQSEHGAGTLEVGEVKQNLAAALVQTGQFAQAERDLREVDNIFALHLPDDHPRRAFPSLTRAEMRIAQGRFAEAKVDAQRAYDLLSRVLPAGHFATEVARCRIGISLLGQGKHKEAKPLIQTAYRGLKASKMPLPDRYLLPCKAAAAKFST
ncbi:serine/threonine-protein kinase [uncultured Parasphingorhabdus sp.]|uniref:serine/threonine-protein kinase n=1 Tax=uncultured Parasphingorhabdus sp. TaxID=2709694 RepID=UPI0030D76C9E|tara:strand:- start:18604 stop:21090 length:2487 start_codon:yes stop_codon:yes gene_type:complete